jgi:hypothetical protein
MRLEVLNNGHRPLQKLAFRLAGFRDGRIPGPVSVLSYRRALYGKHFAAAIQDAMRKMTEWTVGQTELFAAFVSKQNECHY